MDGFVVQHGESVLWNSARNVQYNGDESSNEQRTLCLEAGQSLDLDALRQLIRQEVRAALAEFAPPVVTVQYATPQDRAGIAAEVGRHLVQQARMQGVGRHASAAGVSYAEAEREEGV